MEEAMSLIGRPKDLQARELAEEIKAALCRLQVVHKARSTNQEMLHLRLQYTPRNVCIRHSEEEEKMLT